jgi:agmatine/peptidylarginine deiminase
MAHLPYLKSIFDTLPGDLKTEINAIADQTDVMGEHPMSDDDWRRHEKRIRRSYPQLAQALDYYSDTMTMIEHKNLWRELGFASFRAYMETIEVESYLQKAISEAVKRIAH